MVLDSNLILGACLGDCVHVMGILNFFKFIEGKGYRTSFLGPSVQTKNLIMNIKKSNAQIIALSYRLTPENGIAIIKKLIKQIKKEGLADRDYIFGGLPELCTEIEKLSFFRGIFKGGEDRDNLLEIFLGNLIKKDDSVKYPVDLISRINLNKPFPIIRAHFGLPDLNKTLIGIETIAQSKILDVISIAPDQAAQEWLQHPLKLKEQSNGVGGVPIRNEDDLRKIYKKSRIGNYPLLRIYSGTQDLILNGELFQNTIHNSWAAIPIFWYSQLDGRGPKSLQEAIKEHFEAIKWHADRDIPVEINDPHQWGLRMAPDHFVVTDAYLSAYIAKELGVKTYIEQLMFNTPAGNSFKMDYARILAMIEIVQPLIDNSFEILKETRVGLSYLNSEENQAKGQLCASTLMQMGINPDIIHVVSYSEGTHVAEAADIIESCSLIKKIVIDAYNNLPDFSLDKEIIKRKEELIKEAKTLLDFIILYGKNKGIEEPFLSPEILASIVEEGYLNAPQLRGNKCITRSIETQIIDGKCVVIGDRNEIVSEKSRIYQINLKNNILLKNGGIENYET